METLSDKRFEVKKFKGMTNHFYMESAVKEFIKELKQHIRGIPIKDGYQDTMEIWKRIDKLAGDKLI